MISTVVSNLSAEIFPSQEDFDRIHSFEGESSVEEITQAIELTVPKAVGRPLVRIGGEEDGAYLLPDDFEGVEACFSPGTNNRKDFEDLLLQQYGINSYMIDYSSDEEAFRTPIQAGRQFFQKKWLEPISSEISISLEDWVRESMPEGKNLILQMDIEGAEWRNLITASDDLLSKFRMIIVEVHQLDQLASRSFLQGLFVPIFERINRNHVCVHASPNNFNAAGFCSPNGVGIKIPVVMELTFLRRDRILDIHVPVHVPHPLDIINVKKNRAAFLGPPWAPINRSLESEVAVQKCHVHNLNLEIHALAEKEAVSRIKMLYLYDAFMAAQKNGREGGNPNKGGIMDLAKGKPFTLSSRHPLDSNLELIESKEPFFFMTRESANPSITIDLEQDAIIEEIVVHNRTDRAFRRCDGLFVDLMDDLDAPKAILTIPAFETPGFLRGEEPCLSIPVGGVRARYVRIYSKLKTCLHFSDLTIYGTCPNNTEDEQNGPQDPAVAQPSSMEDT